MNESSGEKQDKNDGNGVVEQKAADYYREELPFEFIEALLGCIRLFIAILNRGHFAILCQSEFSENATHEASELRDAASIANRYNNCYSDRQH